MRKLLLAAVAALSLVPASASANDGAGNWSAHKRDNGDPYIASGDSRLSADCHGLMVIVTNLEPQFWEISHLFQRGSIPAKITIDKVYWPALATATFVPQGVVIRVEVDFDQFDANDMVARFAAGNWIRVAFGDFNVTRSLANSAGAVQWLAPQCGGGGNTRSTSAPTNGGTSL